MRWLNWVDRLFRKDFDLVPHPWNASDDPYRAISWAIELGHLNPADHDARVRQDVETLVRRAGEAIGMRSQKGGHILKADIMLTTKGPMILELTPRLSGGWDSSLSTPERGADFVGGALRLALGEKLDEGIWHGYFAYRKFRARDRGSGQGKTGSPGLHWTRICLGGGERPSDRNRERPRRSHGRPLPSLTVQAMPWWLRACAGVKGRP